MAVKKEKNPVALTDNGAHEQLEGLKFEEGLEELENILELLENEELSLEESIKNYETGVKYYNFCKEKLDSLEKKIEILIKTGPAGETSLAPYKRDEIENPSIN